MRWVVLLAFVSGCQSCEKRSTSDQLPMPSGMLVPMDVGPPEPTEPLIERLRTANTRRPSWFGVASTKGTRFVSVTAFSLMENAFARAEPGFGPFGKREVSAANAPKLFEELKKQREEWLALGTIDDARAKYPEGMRGIDGSWTEIQQTFATTLAEVASIADGGGAVTVSTP